MDTTTGRPREGAPAGTASPSRPRRGWLVWGCSTLLVLFVCLLAGLAYWAYTLYGYTSAEPVALPVYEPKPGEVEALREQLSGFERGLAGEGEEKLLATLELTADDLNALLAGSPEGERYAGKVHFRGEGERMLVDVSLPLSELKEIGLGLVSDRYLNGTVSLRIESVEGKHRIDLESIVAGGKQVPESYLSFIRDPKNLRVPALRRVMETLSAVRKVEVRDGKILIAR